MVTIREHTLDEFWAYLRGQQMYRAPQATFLHHTWVPNASQYHGLSSIEGIRRYHLGLGWSDIAANAYTGPDGIVYNGRALSAGNWCHAAVSRSWAEVKRRNRNVFALCNFDRNWPNHYAFGIETVGNFDSEDPKSSIAMATSLDVLAMVHQLWDIPVERCFAHRDVANKTCPGSRVNMSWVRAELAKRLGGSTGPLKVIMLPGSAVISCAPVLEGGTTRCNLRALAEALGYEVISDHLVKQNKIYLRRRGAL